MLKHGHTKTVNGKTVQSPTYQSYRSMLDRCYREKHPRFPRYGGRDLAGYGEPILVCARWRFGEDGKGGFECFLEDMGVRPADHTLDRKDGDKDYEKSNCRWSTIDVQNNNRSNVKQITIGAVTLSLSQWVDRYDKRADYSRILNRIWQGDDPQSALERFYPPRRKKAA